jgi:hypothetical protein
MTLTIDKMIAAFAVMAVGTGTLALGDDTLILHLPCEGARENAAPLNLPLEPGKFAPSVEAVAGEGSFHYEKGRRGRPYMEVKMPRDAIRQVEALSIGFWLNLDPHMPRRRAGVFADSGVLALTAPTSIYLTEDRRLAVERNVMRDRSPYRLVAERTLQADNWEHIAVTYDLRRIVVYINGQRAGARRVPAQIMRASFCPYFGAAKHRAAPRSFEGRIDEIDIRGRALSADEVRGLFKAP